MSPISRILSIAILLVANIFNLGCANAKTISSPDTYFEAPANKKAALATANGKVKELRSLILDDGVQPDIRGKNDLTLLSIAILTNNKNTFNELIKLGAIGDPNGKTAGQSMYNATLVRSDYWLKKLHKAGASLDGFGGGDRLIIQAMKSKIKGRLDYYLDNGADINAESNLGGNIALTAAMTHRFDLANILIDKGADPLTMNKLGGTIGYYAESVTQLSTWRSSGKFEEERLQLIDKLKAANFPFPALEPKQAIILNNKGQWPSK